MEDGRRSLGLPAEARVVLCGGELTREAGIKDAIWAADILKFLYDDLYLLVVGEGRERPALEQFARDIRIDDRVRFLGRPDDWPALLRLGELVWAPGRADRVSPLVREALAVGRPVVASRVPAMVGVVPDRFLVPPGDKAALARRSRLLLDETRAPQPAIG